MARCDGCGNHALLTVDTSVICSLARYCYGRGGFDAGGSPAEVIAGFSSRFGELIDGICDCSPERRLSTSAVAFSKEQSVDHSESLLRRELCACNPSLGSAEDADWRPVGEVLKTRVAPHQIDVRATRSLAKRYVLPGSVDAFVVVDALLNAQRGKCLLLTFDQGLMDAAYGLGSDPEVEWQGGKLQTANLQPKYALSFVIGQYRRCCRDHMETFKLVTERIEYDRRRWVSIAEPKATQMFGMQVDALGVLRAFYETKVKDVAAAAS